MRRRRREGDGVRGVVDGGGSQRTGSIAVQGSVHGEVWVLEPGGGGCVGGPEELQSVHGDAARLVQLVLLVKILQRLDEALREILLVAGRLRVQELGGGVGGGGDQTVGLDDKALQIRRGFEPFGEHAVNSSWVAVQELEQLGLGEAVDLHVCEIPVEYQAVQNLLPSLWKEQQPQLVVHVGVSGLATTVTLEQCGHNKGYKRLDNCSFCPASQCCMENGPDCIKSVLDMDAVCKRVNDSDIGIAVSVSKDAGRYLCDYTYYTSLYLRQGHAAFVHVPPLGKPYSSQDLGRGLQAVIQEMLKLLEEEHKHNEHCNHSH